MESQITTAREVDGYLVGISTHLREVAQANEHLSAVSDGVLADFDDKVAKADAVQACSAAIAKSVVNAEQLGKMPDIGGLLSLFKMKLRHAREAADQYARLGMIDSNSRARGKVAAYDLAVRLVEALYRYTEPECGAGNCCSRSAT